MRAMGVVAASAIAFMAEEFLNAREWITIVPEARGVSAVIVGAGAAVAVVFFRGGTLADLGFKRPERWSLVPLHVIATLFAFITMQIIAPVVVPSFLTLLEPDFPAMNPWLVTSARHFR